MKVIILAAGQGTRLRPLTNFCPKCMVQVNGITILDRQLAILRECNIKDDDIYIITGYCGNTLEEKFRNTEIHIIHNEHYEITNMVFSLMCAAHVLRSGEDVIVSYGDIIYEKEVFRAVLEAQDETAIVVDDDWYGYWAERFENPLDDAETLLYDERDNLIEIGQKTNTLDKIKAQYIGLMKYSPQGAKRLADLAHQAKNKSDRGEKLWRTERIFNKMYMTDLLQGLIDEGNNLKAVHINRGWYEIDDCNDLQVVENKLKGEKQ